jgi:hypothetical protein
MDAIREGGTGGRDRIRSKRGANRTSAVSNPGATSPISAAPATIVPVHEAVSPHPGHATFVTEGFCVGCEGSRECCFHAAGRWHIV